MIGNRCHKRIFLFVYNFCPFGVKTTKPSEVAKTEEKDDKRNASNGIFLLFDTICQSLLFFAHNLDY